MKRGHKVTRLAAFQVDVQIYSPNALHHMNSPDSLRYVLGKALDKVLGVEEEIDYTLTVRRNHNVE